MANSNIFIRFDLGQTEDVLKKQIKFLENASNAVKTTLQKLNSQTLEQRLKSRVKAVLRNESRGGKWQADFAGYFVLGGRSGSNFSFEINHTLLTKIGQGRRRMKGEDARKRIAFSVLLHGREAYTTPGKNFQGKKTKDGKDKICLKIVGKSVYGSSRIAKSRGGGMNEGVVFWNWARNGRLNIPSMAAVDITSVVRQESKLFIDELRQKILERVGKKQ